MLTIHDRQMIFSYVKAYFFCLVSLTGLFIVVSGDKAIKKDRLVKRFLAVIPAQVSRGDVIFLQAKEAVYIPPQEGDQRTGGWLLKNTEPRELPNWPQDQEDILKPLGDGAY